MKAIWNGKVVAESNDTIVIEGNHYFPPESVKKEFLQTSSATSICPWKGTAHYFNVIVGDKVNKDAAWYYPEPKKAAKEIKSHVAFWKGIEITEN